MQARFRPYRYIKDESFDPIYKAVSKKFLVRSRIFPFLFSFLGILIFATQIVIPLVWFKTKDKIAKPVASTALGLASGFTSFEFRELGVGGSAKEEKPNVPKYYYLTIPKLKIENALVETHPKNLNPDEALGHYVGSLYPGEGVGNTFIYGHSVLPYFFNPRNYKTIFSTLKQLNEGDEFFIDYNNKELRYKVEKKLFLKPGEVNPLAEFKPKYLNESTAVLMTCDPPGTRYKRLLVVGVLTD